MKKRSEVGAVRRAKDYAKPRAKTKAASATDWAQSDAHDETPATMPSAGVPSVEKDATPVWERNMNPEQLEAIRHTDGPVALLAQAGSGKTRALVHRIARMVAEGVDPSTVLAVTFSKKAADEMNERLMKLGVTSARVGTWHSLCLQILKEDTTEWASWAIDDKNKHKWIVKEVVGFKHLNWVGVDLGKVMSFIGLCKANLFAPGSAESMDLAKAIFGAFAVKKASDAYEISQNMLEDRGLLTFDDMLVFVARHLSNEENRTRWAARWNYLLQDEAQDANEAQQTIAELLARDHRNYMVVGDIAQSIYGFRGSKPQMLAGFAAKWSARVIEMNRNYRSGNAIVRTANDIIRPAALRMPSDMVAERGVEGTVDAVASANLDAEAKEFVSWVQDRVNNGASFADCTCLFRTNAQSRALEEALLTTKIPYVVVGGVSFYERREVRDLLAYLRVAVGGALENVQRCINTPFRFLGTAFVERVTDAASKLDLAEGELVDWLPLVHDVAQQAGIQSRQRDSVLQWAGLIGEVKVAIKRGDKPDFILNEIVNKTQYIKFLEKDEGEESIDSSHAANVREMIRVASRFGTTEELLQFIEKNLRAARKQRDDKQAGGERVLLMSIHRSKGLEWPHLFISGMNEFVLPHAKGDIEEERRLAYVAVTRARDSLVLSYVREIALRTGVKDSKPSCFLADIGHTVEGSIERAAPALAPAAQG